MSKPVMDPDHSGYSNDDPTWGATSGAPADTKGGAMINELEPDDEQQCQECSKVYVDTDRLSDGFCSDDCWAKADAREYPDEDCDEQDLEENG